MLIKMQEPYAALRSKTKPLKVSIALHQFGPRSKINHSN